MSDRSDRFLRGRRAGRTPMPLHDAGSATPRVEAPVRPTARRASHTTVDRPPYRRRSVKPRRRDRGLWPWLRPVLTFAVLAGLGIGAVSWVISSPRFRVSAVEVQGEVPELTAWVQHRVTPFVGEPLLVLPLSRVTEAVGEHRWIETLEISRILPDRLSVVIHERQPVALLELEGAWVFADRQGHAIAPVNDPGAGAPEADRLTGLLRVRGGWGPSRGVPEALGVRREVLRAQAVWGAAVVEVEILADGDYRLHTRALSFPVLVRAGEVELKIRWLDRLLPRLVSRWGEPVEVDLRFARRIVLEDVVEQKSERRPERGA